MLQSENILCISSIDWDFNWQGHQEIMATLAQNGHRVLFVENTGVRNPRVGDLGRIRHRYQQWRRSLRGFRQERKNLYVFSPLVLPFPYSRFARWINRWTLTSALRNWMNAMEFHYPICWTFLPTPLILDVLKAIPHKALVYYCIDSFANSTPAAQRIVPSEQTLLKKADLVFVTSHLLYKQAAQCNSNVHLFPFGVSLGNFDRIRNDGKRPPHEISQWTHPVVGYVGGIHQWVDQELLCQVARRHPTYSFMLVGPIQTEVGRLLREPNIQLLGQKPPETLPHYVKHFDIGIIPYRITEYTKNVYPTKLNEYHAMGIPVVSTPLPEILTFNGQYGGLVKIGHDESSFSSELSLAMQDNHPILRQRRQAAAQENGWDRRIESMLRLIEQSLERKKSRPVNNWESRLQASLKVSRILFRWTIGAVLLWGLTFHTPLVWFLAKPLTLQDTLTPADSIVVFAGGVGESGHADQGYRERIKRAVELYQAGLAPEVLLVSGDTWTFDEADVMRALITHLGVPDERILIEKRVSNTFDYCMRVKEISQEQGWKSILLITSPYHSLRAGLTLSHQAEGLTVLHASAPSSQFYGRSGWGITTRQLQGIFHEVAGIFYYWLKGWI